MSENTIMQWINRRLPITNTIERHLTKHPVPSYVNFWYMFGALAALVLVIQLISGIWLLINYENTSEGAFASIEYIMRDVEWGWLLRYMHSTGASFFFIVVYFHMMRAMLYGSYRAPRELVWLIGVAVYLAIMAEGFLGYVLPFGQMSFWGAQVIISLFSAIPVIGDGLATWFRGDYVISGITLSRMLSLHAVVIPLAIIALVYLHIIALHEVGAGNPEGTDIEDKLDDKGVPLDSVPFFPYKIFHALPAIGVFLILFTFVMFFIPEFFGYFLEHANFEPAQYLKTPENIVPVWYYTPFYAMLRATTLGVLGMDAKLLGLIVMVFALVVFALLPWLDRSPVASIRYKGLASKIALGLFSICFVVLGYLGMVPPTPGRELLAQICTVIYFGYFLLMPIYTSLEKTTRPPERLPEVH